MLTVAAEFGLLEEFWLECSDVIEVKVGLNATAYKFGSGPKTCTNHLAMST